MSELKVCYWVNKFGQVRSWVCVRAVVWPVILVSICTFVCSD